MTAGSPLERLARCMTGDVADGLDWVEIVGTANGELAAPALYRRIVQAGQEPHVDGDALEYLRSLDEANRERNRRIWALFREVVAGLNAVGVVPLLLKGGNNLARHDDPGDYFRILVDVDILVTPEELAATERAFGDMGFGVVEGTRYEHSPGSYWRQGDLAPVDLHTSLPPQMSALLPPGGIPRTALRERDGVRFLSPDDSLHILINIAHEMLHDRVLASGYTQLRYLLDLAEQIGDPGVSIDWAWLGEMRAHRSFRLALDVQRLMLAHLLGVQTRELPVPGLAARFLHRRRVFKMRRKHLGDLEWRIVRRGLRAARNAGLQTP